MMFRGIYNFGHNDFYNYYFFVLPEQEELYYLGNYRAADMNGNDEWDDSEEQKMFEKIMD